MNEKFHHQLIEKMREIDELDALQPCSPLFNSWRKSTEGMIREIFGDGGELESFNAIFYTPLYLSCRMNDSAFSEAYRQGLEEARALLSRLSRAL